MFLNERRKISCRGFTRHRNVLSTTNPPPMTRNAAGECYRFINMCTTLNIPSNGASILNFSLHTSIYCLSSPICDSSQFSRSSCCRVSPLCSIFLTITHSWAPLLLLHIHVIIQGGLQVCVKKLTLCYTLLSYYKNVGWKDTRNCCSCSTA